MEAHYFLQDCFMTGRTAFANAESSTNPGIIVQGRYDLLCPPATSHALARGVARV